MENAVLKIDETKQLIQRMDKQFGAALPKQIPSKKFIRTVMTAISDPGITEKINAGKLCQTSLLTACTRAAQDGLLLDGREAVLLTFYSKKQKINITQYIPMVAGLMKKARNSGQIISIVSKVVYENDEFEEWVDQTGEHFKYVPCKNSLKRGEPEKVFALGVTKDGGSQLEVLERADIDKIANFSNNKDQYDPEKGLWFGEWWRKAAIRKVCKYLPSSSELDRLFENDDYDYDQDIHQTAGHFDEDDFSPPLTSMDDNRDDIDCDKNTGAVIECESENVKDNNSNEKSQDKDDDPPI